MTFELNQGHFFIFYSFARKILFVRAKSYNDITSTKIDNENVRVISAKNIEVLYNTEKTNYKVRDMTFSGLLKFIKGIADKECWYSY